MQLGAEASEGKVIIQDIVCAAVPAHDRDHPAGECKFAQVKPEQEKRLINSINALIEKAADIHRTQNCDANGDLKPESVNNIVRLITNEFMFYTKAPLTIDEFIILQQGIADLAAAQPENLHLVLGSFAVRMEEKPNHNKVMNVVPHIECGPEPKINFIVKNFPSELDPIYKEQQKDRTVVLDNLGINVDQELLGTEGVKDKLAERPVKINGNKIPFSFNNVLTCKTAGNERFLSCVDICFDHANAAAKNRFEHKLTTAVKNAERGKETEPLPELCSHILVANSNSVLPSKKLTEVITHVDPHCPPTDCKANTTKSPPSKSITMDFGTPIIVTTTSPLACGVLLDNNYRALVQQHNEKVVTPVPSAFLSAVSNGTKRMSAIFSRTPLSIPDASPTVPRKLKDTRENPVESTSGDLLKRLSSAKTQLEDNHNPSLSGAANVAHSAHSATMLLQMEHSATKSAIKPSTPPENDPENKSSVKVKGTRL